MEGRSEGEREEGMEGREGGRGDKWRELQVQVHWERVKTAQTSQL